MEETGLNDIGDAQPFITVLTDIRIQNSQEDVAYFFYISLRYQLYFFTSIK